MLTKDIIIIKFVVFYADGRPNKPECLTFTSLYGLPFNICG